MSTGQRERRTLQEALVNAIGAESTDTLLGYLPPVGWADVATRHDLDALAAKVDACATKTDLDALAAKVDACATKADLHHELRVQFYWTITIMVMLLGAFAALIKLT